MTDFNFRNHLQTNTFAGYNSYLLDEAKPSSLLTLNSRYTPLCQLGIPSRSNRDVIYYSSENQFRSRTLNKEKVIEVFETSWCLLKLMVAGSPWYIGKGIIVKQEPDMSFLPMLIYTVPEPDYVDNELTDMVLFVDNRYSLQPIVIKQIIANEIKNHFGDTVVTKDMLKYITGKLKLPKFRTPAAKKLYISEFVNKCVELIPE